MAGIVGEGAAGAADSKLNPVVPPDGVDDNNGFGASTVGADVKGDGIDCPNVKAGLGAFVPMLLRRSPKSKVSLVEWQIPPYHESRAAAHALRSLAWSTRPRKGCWIPPPSTPLSAFGLCLPHCTPRTRCLTPHGHGPSRPHGRGVELGVGPRREHARPAEGSVKVCDVSGQDASKSKYKTDLLQFCMFATVVASSSTEPSRRVLCCTTSAGSCRQATARTSRSVTREHIRC